MILCLFVGLVLFFSPDAVVRENVEVETSHGARMEVVHKSEAVKSTKTTIPFVKNNNLDYTEIMSFVGDNYKEAAGWILFVVVTIFVITAVSNASNLTDGMD